MTIIRKIGSNNCLCALDRRLKRNEINRCIMKCVERVNGK